MNWLDYVFIAFLLYAAFASARRGFSREIIGLAAVFFGFLLGMWFYGLAGSFVAPYVSSMRVAHLIGFFLVFFGVLIAGAIAGWIVNRFLRTIGLSIPDRLLGAAFGVVRGILLIAGILTAYIAFGSHVDSRRMPQAVVHSRIAPFVLEASRAFVAMAPMELKSVFRDQYAQVNSAIRRSVRPGDRPGRDQNQAP